MIRFLILIAIIVLLFYLSSIIRGCVYDTSRIATICQRLCDQRGRELGTYEQRGLLVKCNCGKKKLSKDIGPL